MVSSIPPPYKRWIHPLCDTKSVGHVPFIIPWPMHLHAKSFACACIARIGFLFLFHFRILFSAAAAAEHFDCFSRTHQFMHSSKQMRSNMVTFRPDRTRFVSARLCATIFIFPGVAMQRRRPHRIPSSSSIFKCFLADAAFALRTHICGSYLKTCNNSSRLQHHHQPLEERKNKSERKGWKCELGADSLSSPMEQKTFCSS